MTAKKILKTVNLLLGIAELILAIIMLRNALRQFKAQAEDEEEHLT